MRQRIQRMRLLFVNTLQEKGASRDFSFISQQNGMFSFSGLTKEQVLRLREEFAHLCGRFRTYQRGRDDA
ncbi:Aspartate aminotransferase [Klebsiella pneumoniae subsp. ozaenae]|uniref:Aspartate aminotransferase n=1 Tax=Klebsiella pneumoniae subsp. ozaenae TaxID=574 RepID=A0A378BN24_KLEPO|nr:Aspartate aminotransferase [Klebsiella pneumoniae subsp. ozaenae]